MIYYGIGSGIIVGNTAKVAAKECKLGSDLLSKLWYGKKGAQALETDP